MTPDDLLAHLRLETTRFRAVLADCDPAARVPTCPAWNATDLLWHLGAEVQAFWAHVVITRPAPPATWDDPVRPTGAGAHAAALARLDEGHAALVAALEAADPGEAAWTWSREQTVGFTVRRQAHEALVHRVDAELTAGLAPGPVDPALAADGVLETLDVMFGGTPSWGAFTPGRGHVRFDLTDVPAAAPVWVELGHFSGTDPRSGTTYADEPDLGVVRESDLPPGAEPDVVVTGPAAGLDLWLWHRTDDTGITVDGDPEVLAGLRAVLDQSID